VARRAAAVALALALVGACSGGDADDEAQPPASPSTTVGASTTAGETAVGGTLRLGIGRLPSLDPADVSPGSPSSAITADLLYDGLTSIRPGGDGTAQPALASTWTTNDGGVTWRFTLRSDAVFADGRPVSAADVEASLERVAARATSSIGAAPLGVLADVLVVGPADVDVVLERPMIALPELLAAPAFGIVAAEVAAGANPASNPSGPFRLAAVEGDVVRLVRARDGSALLDGIDLHQHDDLNAAVDAFDAGTLDWTLVPPERAEAVAEAHGTAGFVPHQSELFLGFNLADPTFADGRFRRAMVAAIDREVLVRALYFGVATPLSVVVPAGVPGHNPTRCGDNCGAEALRAERLLDLAFPAGGPPVPEVLLDHEATPTETALAQALEQQLEAAGIPVTLRSHPSEEFPVFAASGQQALVRLGWVGGWVAPDAYLEPLFRTDAPDNIPGFTDARVDALLDAASRAVPASERLRLLGEAEALVLEAAPIIPLAQFQLLSVASPAVQNLVLGVDGTFDGEAVSLAAS
jgi:ABC-type transport system substrate-binding protein